MTLIRQLGKAVFATADLFLPTPRGPRILIYHQVGADLGRQMEVTLEDFVWQLDWLSENREVVDLDTAVERWVEPGSESLVVLTFDDGYRDTYATAFPYLKERGLPMTLYLATETIGDDGRITWGEVEEMVSTGLVTVGAHTHRHRDLRHASHREVEEELTMSNRLIGNRIGVWPRHFAYPWGYWSTSADSIVRQQYETAVLGAPPPRIRFDSTLDPYLIHRYPVQLSDGRWFTGRLDRGLVLEEGVRRLLRGYRGP